MASIEEVLGDDLLEKILAEVEDYQTLLNLGGTSLRLQSMAHATLLQKAEPTEASKRWRLANLSSLRPLTWCSRAPSALLPILLQIWASQGVPAPLAKTLMLAAVSPRHRPKVLAALTSRAVSSGEDDSDDSGEDDDDKVVDGVRTVVLHSCAPERVPGSLGRRRGRPVTKACGNSFRCDGSCRIYVGDDARETRIVLLLRRPAGASNLKQYAIEKRTRLVSNKHRPGTRFHRVAFASGGSAGSSSSLGAGHWHGRACRLSSAAAAAPSSTSSLPRHDLQCCCHLDDRGRPGGLSQRMLEIPGMASSIAWRCWDEPAWEEDEEGSGRHPWDSGYFRADEFRMRGGGSGAETNS